MNILTDEEMAEKEKAFRWGLAHYEMGQLQSSFLELMYSHKDANDTIRERDAEIERMRDVIEKKDRFIDSARSSLTCSKFLPEGGRE